MLWSVSPSKRQVSFEPALTDTFGRLKNMSPTEILPRLPSAARRPGGASMFTALPFRIPTIGTVNGGGLRRPFGMGSCSKSRGRAPHLDVTDASGAMYTMEDPHHPRVRQRGVVVRVEHHPLARRHGHATGRPEPGHVDRPGFVQHRAHL